MAVKMTRKNNIKLEEINKGNPFHVPQNYFENFPVRMADKIIEADSAKAKVPVFAWMRLKYAAAFALAGFGLIILIGVLFINPKNKPMSSREMVEAYRYSAIQDLSDEQLAQMIADKQVKSDTTKTYKEDVIDYLSKENIDINTIIEAQ